MGKIICGIVLLLLGSFFPIGGIGPLAHFAGLALLVWGIASIVIKRGKGAAMAAAGAAYSFVGGGTAIAIYPDKKTLLLKQGSKQKEYAFDDVRKWEANLHTGGMAIGTGAAAAGHNFRTARDNKKNSGLFVTVRDIDTPVWRIEMLKESDQNRWMEILRQLINEG